MRAFLRCVTVLVPLVMIVVIGLTPARAQLKLNTFDTAVADSQFVVGYNVSASDTDPHPYHHMFDDAASKVEGGASLRSEWRVHTTESWGGFNTISYTVPTKTQHSYYNEKYRALYGDSTYIAWGAGGHLSLWYNNVVPSNGAGDVVQMRFHIYDAGGASKYYTGDSADYEVYYFQSAVPTNNTTPGWHELIIPLVDQGTIAPNASGFSNPGWAGKPNNGKLDWDNIIGYVIEWTSGKALNDTASGILAYDDLRLEGIGSKTGYEALYRFNNYTTNVVDFASGWGNDASAIAFTEETVDTLMGSSVMAWDWSIQVAQSWGGGVNKEYNLPASTYFADLSSKQELQLYVKVVKPITSTKGAIQNKITLRFVLFDYSNGAKEEWYTVAPIRMDSAALQMGWQMVRMPLDWIQSNAWGDLKKGRFNTPNGPKDNILGLDKVGGYKLEFSCSADPGEPSGDPTLVYSGKVLFSALVPSGVRQTDHTPPAAVTGVQVTPATNQNILTWTDVPGEVGATYATLVSPTSFTLADDPFVENIPGPSSLSIPTATQINTHVLRAPVTDQQVQLYYGVTATDNVGNTNNPAVVGPITNTAKGVPTFSLSPPSSFVADGDLSEWLGIPPLILSVAGASPTAYAAPNSKIDGDADLKVTAYLAMDATYLYVAFDVVDNVISIDTTVSQSWFQDSPDMFIGLYDWRGHRHGGYQHGTAPDYHLRFSLNKVIIDNASGATLVAPGPDYLFNLKQLETGYTVEARIPWTRFQAVVPADSVFHPVEGMRIPIDFEINDNDTPGSNQAREGQMDYSPYANGTSYADVWRWTYTWVGTKATVGVNDRPTVANVYDLKQNYPNPFNPSTQIRYSLEKAGNVSIKVFDVLGREVATLVNENQNPGDHAVSFNSASIRGGLSSGVYFYRIESGSFLDVKKMMLLK